MDSIMRAYRRSSWLAVTALITALGAPIADAEFRVANVEPRLGAENACAFWRARFSVIRQGRGGPEQGYTHGCHS